MKRLNNSPILNLCNFIIVLFVAVSCTNNSNLVKTIKKEVEAENKDVELSEDEKMPICYSKNALDSIDQTSLRMALKKIAEIKEVRDYSNQNPNKILYCVTETEADDIYQTNSYHVQIVLDTKYRYSTRFNFYINKQTEEIKILEVVSDSLMSIDEWRKAQ